MKLFKILPIALLFFCVQFGFSQEKETEEEVLKEVAQDAEELKKKDNTGTNPVNFTYDFRLYQEMLAIPILLVTP